VKIVLDTTILVRSNEHSQGVARELLISIIDGPNKLLLSNEMLHELARVLQYPRLRAFYDLPESLLFDYVDFLRYSSEIVALNPLLAAPIRDVNDIVVMQTAIIGEADIVCTRDEGFFAKPASEYLSQIGISVTDDISLIDAPFALLTSRGVPGFMRSMRRRRTDGFISGRSMVVCIASG
jgi:putative PIN family toxin of toxin-antitoxin system